MFADYGPEGDRQPDGVADHVPVHAVRGYLPPEGRHLSVGYGPAEGERAGA